MDSRDHFTEDRTKAIGSFPRFGEETNLKKESIQNQAASLPPEWNGLE